MDIRITIPEEKMAEMLATFEANNPLPEYMMLNGVKVPNPYTSRELFELLLISAFHSRVVTVLGSNGINVTKITEE